MIIQIFALLMSFASADTVNLRCVLMDRDENSGPLILETQLTAGDSDHTFQLAAPVKITSSGLSEMEVKIEFPPEQIQVCDGDRKSIVLSTTDCKGEAPGDDFHLTFANWNSWDNYATFTWRAAKPPVIGEFKRVWCYPSRN